jgi:hypothetical protein
MSAGGKARRLTSDSAADLTSGLHVCPSVMTHQMTHRRAAPPHNGRRPGHEEQAPMPDPTVRGHLVAKIGELVGPSVQDPGRDQGGARAASPGEGPVVPERHHHVLGDDRRDPAAGPRPAARRGAGATSPTSRRPLVPPLGRRVGGGCTFRGGDRPAPAVVTVSRWRLRRWWYRSSHCWFRRSRTGDR